MAQVVWTDRALADVEAIYQWIAHDRPLAAQRMAQRFLEAGDRLETNPLRGRAIARGRRELVFVRPYLIRYRIETERVLILEVRHGARRSD